jgi:hypothetical protein
MHAMQHDWFADLTGFRETSYDATREQLFVEGDELVTSERHAVRNRNARSADID